MIVAVDDDRRGRFGDRQAVAQRRDDRGGFRRDSRDGERDFQRRDGERRDFGSRDDRRDDRRGGRGGFQRRDDRRGEAARYGGDVRGGRLSATVAGLIRMSGATMPPTRPRRRAVRVS